MMSAVGIFVTILGLAALMVVHESGHHFVARAFKLRVLRFSIGFGPALWRYQPRGSDTVYQIALIPFLAYVQVAGMNPFEESDPADKGSYANASLPARVLTILAGPLANYAFAMGLFFFAFVAFGRPMNADTVDVIANTPAAAGNMQSGDKVLRIDGAPIADFDALREVVLKQPGKALRVEVERKGETIPLTITPEPKGENGGGLIGVRPGRAYEAMTTQEALTESVQLPAIIVRDLVVGLARLVTQQEKPEVAGPVRIVEYGALIFETGTYDILYFLARLSAYLGGFNLLPVPALDGGRLMFLLYEAVARRKPNARMEAQIHALGLLMFLALMVVVTVKDFQR
jgi:regulator of sigma E protease